MLPTKFQVIRPFIWFKHILFQQLFVKHTSVHVINMKTKKVRNESKYAYMVLLLLNHETVILQIYKFDEWNVSSVTFNN